MKYYRKLARKIEIYERLARIHRWSVLSNDRPLETVIAELRGIL